MTHKKQLSLFEETKKEKYKFSPRQKEETVLRLKKILEKIEENIEKYPEHKKSASKNFQYDEIINQVKQKLKNNDVVKKLFKKYNVDLEELEYIPICFRPLEVSATTKSGIIYLNPGLLEECDPDDIGKCINNVDHYVCHEISHYLQQTHFQTIMKENENYLDDKNEQEGFQIQTEFIADTKGEEEAENYIDQVIDHHNVPEKEKEDKKDELLSIAIKHKIAGLFEAPPILLKKVHDNIFRKWCTEVYKENNIRKRQIDNNLRKNKNISEYKNIEQILKSLDKFKTENKNLESEIIDHYIITKEYLKNWNVVDYNEIDDNFKVNLYVRLKLNEDIQVAYMNYNDDIMKSNIFIELPANIFTMNSLAENLQWLKQNIKHEVIHVGQSLLQHIKGLNQSTGLSKRKFRDKKYDILGTLLTNKTPEFEKRFEDMDNIKYTSGDFEDDQPHELRDVEFYTNLNDEVSIFERNIKKLPRELHDLYFKYHVAFPTSDKDLKKLQKYNIEETDLFQRLHNGNLGKWKKAVKEFYKAVKDRLE